MRTCGEVACEHGGDLYSACVHRPLAVLNNAPLIVHGVVIDPQPHKLKWQRPAGSSGMVHVKVPTIILCCLCAPEFDEKAETLESEGVERLAWKSRKVRTFNKGS